MKLNWGHYIVIGFTAFVILILYMVFRSYQNDNELVSEDYYAQEIEFQEVIDKKTRAAKLEENISWVKTSEGLLFTFPDLGTPIEGEIYLFRPSEKALDVRVKIEVDQNHQQLVKKSNMKAGKYLIKVDWLVGEVSFFTEGALIVME